MSRRCPTLREQKLRIVKKMREIERRHLASASRANAAAKKHETAAREAARLASKTMSAKKLSAKFS